MAGLLGKIKTLVGIEEEYDDDYYEDDYQQDDYADDNDPLARDPIWDTPKNSRYTPPPQNQHMQHYQNQAQQQSQQQQRQRSENVIPMPTSGRQRLAELTTKFNIMVIEPKGFDESTKLVDSLKSKKPVIVNLEIMETKIARKIFDFLCGATYALDGDLQKIANNIFVFLPENVDVTTNTTNTNTNTPFGGDNANPWKL